MEDSHAHEPQSLTEVLGKWRAVGLDEVRPTLDEQALAIADAQEASLKSRKQLTETTREFKKDTQEEVKKAIGPLLKRYQEEVDTLTKRAKFAEGAYLDLYRKFFDTPDPVQALETLMDWRDKATRVDDDKRRMSERIAKLESELNQLSNQEITVRRLEQKLQSFDAEVEAEVDRRVRAVEVDMVAAHKQELELKHDTEVVLRKDLAKALEEKVSLETTMADQQTRSLQLLTIKAQELEAKSQEVKYLSDQLEHVHESLASHHATAQAATTSAASATNSTLPSQQQPASASDTAEHESKLEKLRQSLQAKQEALDRSCARVLQQNSEIQHLREDGERLKHRYDTDVSSRDRTIENLQRLLETRPSVEEHLAALRELSLLKAVEYGVQDTSNLGGDVDLKQLSSMLNAKARKLEEEVTALKSTKRDLETQITQLTDELVHVTTREQEAKSLVAKLEREIETSGSFHKQTESQLGDIMGQVDEGSSEMSQLYKAQRDRFRNRVKHLEEENLRLQESLDESSKLVTALQQDNVELYRKMRFVQFYPSDQQRRHKTRQSVVELGRHEPAQDDTEDKYNKIYEHDVDPFTEFSQNERRRRRRNLSPIDRLVLEATTLIMGHRNSRMGFVIYTLLLHVLVFLILYHYVHQKC